MPIKGQNLWTEDQRMVLHLLHKDFSFDETTRAAIFNHIFADYLKSHGVTRRVTADVLSSQYSDRNRPGRSVHWRSILRTSSSDLDRAKRDDAREWIQDAAKVLEVEVTSKGSTPGAIADVEAEGTIPVASTAKQAATSNSKAPAVGDELGRLTAVQGQDGLNALDSADSGVSRHPEPRSPADKCPFICGSYGGKGAQNAHPTETPPPTQQTRLRMVHRSNVKWKNDVLILDFTDGALIDETSSIYQHGGQVHRVSFLGKGDVDCMICDPNFCTTCDESTDTNAPGQTPGFPFVHCSDTIRKSGLTMFEPTPKSHAAIAECRYLRKIQFQSTSGTVSCTALICDYAQCTVCSGSEHIRVQKNIKLDRLEASGKGKRMIQ